MFSSSVGGAGVHVGLLSRLQPRQQQLPRRQRPCRLKTVRPSCQRFDQRWMVCQRFDQRWMVQIGIRTYMYIVFGSKPTRRLRCTNRFPGRTLHNFTFKFPVSQTCPLQPPVQVQVPFSWAVPRLLQVWRNSTLTRRSKSALFLVAIVKA